MSWYEATLSRGGGTAAVRIAGPSSRGGRSRVEVRIGRAPVARRTYRDRDIAACVFEGNVAGLRDEGWTLVEERCDESVPGALAHLPRESEDEVYWLRWRDGAVVAALFDGGDVQAIFDGIGRTLNEVRPFGRFGSGARDPEWALVHAVRRLIRHPASSAVERIALATSSRHDLLLDLVSGSHLAPRVTHLVMSRSFSDEPGRRQRSLSTELPGIEHLTIEHEGVSRLVDGPLGSLRHLRLQRRRARDPSSPSVAATLDRADRFTPALSSLALSEAGVDPEALRELLEHPLARRVRTLDLVALGHRFPLDALLASRARVPEVETVFIGDHRLDDAERRRADAWPAVCRVDHRGEHPRYRAYLDAIAF